MDFDLIKKLYNENTCRLIACILRICDYENQIKIIEIVSERPHIIRVINTDNTTHIYKCIVGPKSKHIPKTTDTTMIITLESLKKMIYEHIDSTDLEAICQLISTDSKTDINTISDDIYIFGIDIYNLSKDSIDYKIIIPFLNAYYNNQLSEKDIMMWPNKIQTWNWEKLLDRYFGYH
jgi:hypothetical protein